MNTKENMQQFVKDRLEFYNQFDFPNQIQELDPYSCWEWQEVLLKNGDEKRIAFICTPEPMLKIYGRKQTAQDDLEKALLAPLGEEIFVPDTEKTLKVIRCVWQDQLPDGDWEVTQVLPFDRSRWFQFRNSVEWLLGDSHLPLDLWTRPASEWQPQIIEREQCYFNAILIDLRPWFKDFLGEEFIQIMESIKSCAMKWIGKRPEMLENCDTSTKCDVIRNQRTWDARHDEIEHMWDKYTRRSLR